MQHVWSFWAVAACKPRGSHINEDLKGAPRRRLAKMRRLLGGKANASDELRNSGGYGKHVSRRILNSTATGPHTSANQLQVRGTYISQPPRRLSN